MAAGKEVALHGNACQGQAFRVLFPLRPWHQCVLLTMYEVHAAAVECRSQVVWLHFRRQASPPEHGLCRTRSTSGKPAGHGGHALGIAQDMQGAVSGGGLEKLDERIEVTHMVVDLVLAVLAGHPCGAHPLMRVIEVEPAEPFRGHHGIGPRHRSEGVQEIASKLAIPVHHHPEPARGGRIAELMEAGRAAHADEALLHG